MNFLSKVARRLRSFGPVETLDGYEHPELIEMIFRKTVAYTPIDFSWPEIAGAKTVLDFGGGCGLHYRQANSETVKWAVVETPAMVARAAALATERLRFFTSVRDAAAWLGDVDVMHSEGALQFAENPTRTLVELCAVGADTMLWNRMNPSRFGTGSEIQTSWLVDNGPGQIRGVKDKLVTYKVTRIPERDFLAAHSGYRLVERGPQSFRFQRK